ncbi:MAG: SIS domain-containing protein [Patescibacteria group bacterium]
MINLDDTKSILETQGGDAVIISTRAFPKQITTSFRDVGSMQFDPGYKEVENIILCGMGGSRFPGLIAYYLFKDSLKIPFIVCDDYILPEFVNEKTLVILSSYSGTTEEVVHMGKAAFAKKAKIVGYCVGGELASFLESNNLPRYIFDPTLNPSGQPRIGFGYAIGALFGILAKLNLIKGKMYESLGDELEKDCADLEKISLEFDFESKTGQNRAKDFALEMLEKYPYFIVAEHITGVGNAIQNQINETSKNISSYRVIPELNHHLMEGLKHPHTHSEMALFVMIESPLYSPRVQKRYEVTKDVVNQNNIKTITYKTKGSSKIGDVLEIATFGSFLSMYLAALYGVDPAKIPYVDYFKKQLKA